MMNLILAQNSGAPVALAIVVVYIAVFLAVIIGGWKMFAKAGQPGWGIIVPILNIYFMCKIAGRPGWWVILFFIPVISLVFWFILAIDIAKSFGKGTGFGIGLAILSFIFIPILGFGSAEYQGPAAA